jgi:hypothetical protein
MFRASLNCAKANAPHVWLADLVAVDEHALLFAK